MARSESVSELIDDFVQRLTSVLQQETETRARAAVLGAFGGGRAPISALRSRKRADPRLKLAGRYMGLIRRMKKSDQKQIKNIRATKGVEAAIEAMNRIVARG